MNNKPPTPEQVKAILNDSIHKDTSLSLGFRRLTALPIEAEVNMSLSHYLTTGETDPHKAKVKFFQDMTANEYETYIKNLRVF